MGSSWRRINEGVHIYFQNRYRRSPGVVRVVRHRLVVGAASSVTPEAACCAMVFARSLWALLATSRWLFDQFEGPFSHRDPFHKREQQESSNSSRAKTSERDECLAASRAETRRRRRRGGGGGRYGVNIFTPGQHLGKCEQSLNVRECYVQDVSPGLQASRQLNDRTFRRWGGAGDSDSHEDGDTIGVGYE